eukprot:g10206.t1
MIAEANRSSHPGHGKESTFNAGLSLNAQLLLAAGIRLLQTVITFGAMLPSGLFIPSLFIGATVGRFIGNVSYLLEQHIEPGVFAMIGAAAMLAGFTRMTVSLVVIMFELTGELTYVIPFMCAVITAKVVGDLFTSSIYEEHATLNGFAIRGYVRLEVLVADLAEEYPFSKVVDVDTYFRFSALCDMVGLTLMYERGGEVGEAGVEVRKDEDGKRHLPERLAEMRVGDDGRAEEENSRSSVILVRRGVGPIFGYIRKRRLKQWLVEMMRIEDSKTLEERHCCFALFGGDGLWAENMDVRAQTFHMAGVGGSGVQVLGVPSPAATHYPGREELLSSGQGAKPNPFMEGATLFQLEAHTNESTNTERAGKGDIEMRNVIGKDHRTEDINLSPIHEGRAAAAPQGRGTTAAGHSEDDFQIVGKTTEVMHSKSTSTSSSDASGSELKRESSPLSDKARSSSTSNPAATKRAASSSPRPRRPPRDERVSKAVLDRRIIVLPADRLPANDSDNLSPSTTSAAGFARTTRVRMPGHQRQAAPSPGGRGKNSSSEQPGGGGRGDAPFTAGDHLAGDEPPQRGLSNTTVIDIELNDDEVIAEDVSFLVDTHLARLSMDAHIL